jgi:hypothetical protein
VKSEVSTIVLVIQGLYYVAFGAWPLIHMRSFLAVTGRKGKYDNLDTGDSKDHWLIVTVSLFLVAVGGTLLASIVLGEVARVIFILSSLVASSLAFVDIFYVYRGVIARIYLLDAAMELLFIISVVSALTLH